MVRGYETLHILHEVVKLRLAFPLSLWLVVLVVRVLVVYCMFMSCPPHLIPLYTRGLTRIL